MRQAENSSPASSDIGMPDTIETLVQLEQRISAKIRQQLSRIDNMDVGTEPLLISIQVFHIPIHPSVKQNSFLFIRLSHFRLSRVYIFQFQHV